MAAKETPEVMVTGNLITTREFDRVKSTVCLLKPGCYDPSNMWMASGFYVKMKLTRKGKQVDVHCIMTNHHVFRIAENTTKIVAVFNHEGGDERIEEVELKPSALLAAHKELYRFMPYIIVPAFTRFEELDYALIRVSEKEMSSLGIKPILAQPRNVPNVGDSVYIIQHPSGMEKHFSTEKIKNIIPPFIEYYADTLRGSSGSPVFVADGSKYVLIALHCKGVTLPPYTNWNKGVLISEILNHLNTGKYTKSTSISLPGVPGQVESGMPCTMGSKSPTLPVTREDIGKIAFDTTKVWLQFGRALGLSDADLDSIDLDHNTVYEKCYQMLTKWQHTKVLKANYGALANAFTHPAVGRDDLISKYC